MKKNEKKEVKVKLKITKLESKVAPLCNSRTGNYGHGGCIDGFGGALGVVADY